ncbi:hypothetical protein Bbelb_302620 [Branchiostoma belcheri]|nr:hypothetical protein Bbelb_302620 [Branchiostoma belcheri]
MARHFCQGLQQCNWSASGSFLQCPDTRNYLEVTFHCEEKKESVTFGGSGNKPGQFNTLKGLVVSSTNEILLADYHNRRIQVFSMKGEFLRNFSTGNMHPESLSTGRNDTLFAGKGSGPGKINGPTGICVDSLGRVIVADTANSRVEMFTAEGEYIGTVAYMNRPQYVAAEILSGPVAKTGETTSQSANQAVFKASPNDTSGY